MNFKKVKKYFIRILLIIGIVVLIFGGLKLRDNSNQEIISSHIEEKVSKIIELSTIKYNYTDVLSYKDSKKLKGLNIPLTQKSFIVKYSGYIKAGIDLTTVEINLDDRDTINITMDKAKVLENVIIEEEVEFFDEKNGIFNKLNFTDLYEVLVEEKEKIKEEAIMNGLLIEAESNAKSILVSLLEEMNFENITIKFQ